MSTDKGVLLLSIPYDPGWTVWLDGEIQEIRKVDQALMAIPVSAGEHRVTMLFRPEGLSQGLLISVAALVIFILVIILSIFRRKKREQAAVGEIIASDGFLSDPDEKDQSSDKIEQDYMRSYLQLDVTNESDPDINSDVDGEALLPDDPEQTEDN